MRLTLSRFAALMALSFAIPSQTHAQADSERALITALFTKLQPISIRENREFCGYIGFDLSGKLRASPATQGDTDSCEPDDPAEIEVITASYHTHGAFSADFHNEVPSVDDLEGDEAEGIDGYVATPGGRLWYLDSEAMVISQLCGIGCLPRDPNFILGDDGRIAVSYDYDALVDKMDK